MPMGYFTYRYKTARRRARTREANVELLRARGRRRGRSRCTPSAGWRRRATVAQVRAFAAAAADGGRPRREPVRLRDDERRAVARAQRGRLRNSTSDAGVITGRYRSAPRRAIPHAGTLGGVGSAVVAALISIVGLATGPKPGVQVWTGTPAHLGTARTVPGATSPVLSPDGKRVAYALSGELRVQPVGGGPVRTLTQVPGKDPPLAWSPDAARIAFPSEFSIVLLPVLGKGPVRLVRLPKAWEGSTLTALAVVARRQQARFSRTSGDGKKNTLRNELDVIGVDGKGARTLHVNPAPYGARAEPSWSPDSKRIAFNLDEFRLRDGLGRRRRARPPDEPTPRRRRQRPDLVAGRPVDRLRPLPVTRRQRRLAGAPGRHRPPPPDDHPDPAGGRRPLGSVPLAWSPDGTQLLAFRHDRFAVVEVATRASRDLKRVGLQYSLLGARWALTARLVPAYSRLSPWRERLVDRVRRRLPDDPVRLSGCGRSGKRSPRRMFPARSPRRRRRCTARAASAPAGASRPQARCPPH